MLSNQDIIGYIQINFPDHEYIEIIPLDFEKVKGLTLPLYNQNKIYKLDDRPNDRIICYRCHSNLFRHAIFNVIEEDNILEYKRIKRLKIINNLK